jgi:hypothetical protein
MHFMIGELSYKCSLVFEMESFCHSLVSMNSVIQPEHGS